MLGTRLRLAPAAKVDGLAAAALMGAALRRELVLSSRPRFSIDAERFL
jgi:hypothetical protein